MIKQINEFTTVTAGGTPNTSNRAYWGGSILWMNSGELNLHKIFNVQGRITELGLNNSSTKLIPEKCVLVGLAGQGKTRGTVAINYVETCINQSIAAIYPSSEHISEYLYYNLARRYNEIREMSSGDGGRGGLNLRIIGSIKVELPPMQIQHHIVNIHRRFSNGVC